MDNPAGKAVVRVLPRMSKLKSHHKSLPYQQVPNALGQVRESTANTLTRLSFEFLVLTAARSGEVRISTWSEIDLESSTWTVPAERMKARREHRVPLCRRCLGILAEAGQLNPQSSALIFPAKNGESLSDMIYAALLRRLRIPAVPHGFRRSFKNWSMEASFIDDRWFLSELALAHDIGDETAKAYATTDLLEPRRPMMEAWAEFCLTECGLPTGRGEG